MKKNIFFGLLFLLLFPLIALADEKTTDPHLQSPQVTPTLIENAVKKEKKILKLPFSIILFHSNYLLPYYYSSNPQSQGTLNPGDQKLKHYEVKYQISFKVPIWQNIISIHDHPISLFGAYTQMSYWQLYQHSAFFRETDYKPELFFSMYLLKSTMLRTGFSHESNGRGGMDERSWNRWFVNTEYSTHRLFLGVQAWTLVLKKDSVAIYNPDISTYMGHEIFYIGYKLPFDIKLLVKLRNVEHLKNYFTQIVSLSIPLSDHLQFYGQFFHGYGQSLIEYNQKTTSFGVGLALNQYF